MPGLHISQGILLKIFNLLENACHDLDVKMVLIHSGHTALSPSYTHHVLNLQELNRTKAELDTALHFTDCIVQGEQRADGNVVLSCMEAALHVLRQRFTHVAKIIMQSDNAKILLASKLAAPASCVLSCWAQDSGLLPQ